MNELHSMNQAINMTEFQRFIKSHTLWYILFFGVETHLSYNVFRSVMCMETDYIQYIVYCIAFNA